MGNMNSGLFDFESVSLNWKAPFGFAFFYILYVTRMNRSLSNTTPKERKLYSAITLFMFLHNIFLAIFSFITFISTFPIVYYEFRNSTLDHFFTDKTGAILKGLSKWTWYFYLSKFYEVFDTIILHINGKRSSFLQGFHHSGAVIACWLLSICKSHIAWVFVVLNSFVHSFMYIYYGLSTLGIKFKYKRLITNMQMIQFVTGVSILMAHVYLSNPFSEKPELRKIQKLTLWFNASYVIVLYILFHIFSKRTYSKKVKTD